MFKNRSSTSKIKVLSNRNIKQLWSLRKKILFSMTALLLLLGLSTALTIRMILLGALKAEFRQKGLSLARSLAADSVVDVLTQNTSRLKKLVDNEKELDTDIAYVFITDYSNHILAHTFQNGFPIDLLKANTLTKNKSFNIQLLDTQIGLIYDSNIPIFSGKSLIGQVRLGILRNSIQRTILLIDSAILVVTLLIIIIGILLAYKISALITQPISRLVEATQSIQKGDFSVKIDIKTKDEIGLLACAFNEMTFRLNEMVGQIKRLTMVEERNKIGLDLHDGCAQDLANIIKRLELCEKLFRIEPAKAFEELNALRENIRLHLGKARQIIHGLKSPQGSDFVLSQELKEYIKDYGMHSDINIKLNISEPFNGNMPTDKSRQIFHIITEALTNIKKHAQAKNVQLSLDYNGTNELAISIKDDGKGFDLKEAQILASSGGKWGLMGMGERASALGGTLAINSAPNRGTELIVRIPYSSIIYNI